MTSSRTITWSLGIWAFVLALYAGVSLSHPRGSQTLVAFGDVVQCTVPLIANAGLLLNAGTPYWRRNIFWMLIALSCTLWMIGQFEWTYYEVYLHKPLPGLYPGDILFFLRGIPLIAALALQPHRKRSEEHTSELQSRLHLVCRLLLEKKKKKRLAVIDSYPSDRHLFDSQQSDIDKYTAVLST